MQPLLCGNRVEEEAFRCGDINSDEASDRLSSKPLPRVRGEVATSLSLNKVAMPSHLTQTP